MAPLARCTWASRGRTPELVQKSGTREKVSVLAALCLSPRQDQLELYRQTLINGYFDNWQVGAFLEAMLGGVTGRIVVVWDGGSMHKGGSILELAERFADRLSLERLPPYAPMLNPVEPLWSWPKWERLSNFPPHDARDIDARVTAELSVIRTDRTFLRNLFHASKLPLPRALLS